MIARRYRFFAGVAAVGLAATAQGAFAQEAATTPEADNVAEDSIVVIGTRRTDRTVTDSPSPVDVIAADDLVGQATTNVMDAVRAVVPSFFVGQNSISDASTFVRSPSLRGLSGDQTLVMINGKRFNRSALVQVYAGGDTALSFGSQAADISSIPALAVSNLQVLREGATAQYGSDAIAGVFNFGLKKGQGLELQAKYGQFYEGDGEGWSVGAHGGLDIGDRGYINLTAEYSDDKGTSRGAQVPSALFLEQTQSSLASKLPNYPGPAQIWGSSPRNAIKGVINAGFDVTDAIEIYAFGNYGRSEGDQSFNYRPVLDWALERFNGTATSVAGGSRNSAFYPVFLTPCPAGNATCPAGSFVRDTNTYNFSTLYPAGFTPRFVGVAEEIYGSGGIRSNSGPLTWDLSLTYGQHSLDLSMYSSLNASYGPQSQTEFELGKLRQRELIGNLDLAYEIDAGLASPLTLSGGLEYRREQYAQIAGDLQSYSAGPYAVQPLYDLVSPGVYTRTTAGNCPQPQGSGVTTCTVTKSPAASGYGGTNPAAAGQFSQRSYGAYVGLEGDITDNFSFGVAGRIEDYNTFGTATVWKANALWKLTPEWSLRGSVGTGFHAPSPGQSNAQILTTSFTGGNQVQTGTYPVGSAIAQYYGATDLGPEKSTNYGFGFVFEPASNLTLTVDGYLIKVRERIGISQQFNVTAADIVKQPALSFVGTGGVVQYFTNGFDTSTQGLDVVGTWRTRMAGGPLNLTLAYNYNRSVVTRFDQGVINAQRLIDIEYFAPQHRANLSANWQLGNFAINLREMYYGSWRDSNDYPIRVNNITCPTGVSPGPLDRTTPCAIFDGQHFKAKFLTDLDVSYTFMNNFTLTVGANNLFDTYPTKIKATVNNPVYTATGSILNGSVYPRPGGPFGFNGGQWYVKLGVKY